MEARVEMEPQSRPSQPVKTRARLFPRRPFALLCFHVSVGRMLPGVSGVPLDLKRLGVGPMLYCFLVRAPGLPEKIVNALANVAISSLLD